MKHRKVRPHESCNSPKSLIRASVENRKEQNSQRLVEYVEVLRKASGSISVGELLKKRKQLVVTILCDGESRKCRDLFPFS